LLMSLDKFMSAKDQEKMLAELPKIK